MKRIKLWANGSVAEFSSGDTSLFFFGKYSLYLQRGGVRKVKDEYLLLSVF